MGSGDVEPIVTERNEGGEFKSIEDLCRRCDLHAVNRRVMESLIKAGALDSLGERGTLLNNVGRLLSLAQREQRLRETGQSTMFDLWGEEVSLPVSSLDLVPADISTREKLGWERELMGVYLSEHPLSSVAGEIGADTTLCGQIDAELAGQNVVVVGMVGSVRQLFTRDRRPFASVIIEDLGGQVEVMVWPRVYADTSELWQEGNILHVEGKVRLKDDRIQLNCDRVSRFQPAAKGEEIMAPQLEETTENGEKAAVDTTPAESRRLVISISQTEDEDRDIAYLYKLIAILRDFPGRDEVKLSVINGEKITNLKLANIYTDYCPALHYQLTEILGEDGLRVETNG